MVINVFIFLFNTKKNMTDQNYSILKCPITGDNLRHISKEEISNVTTNKNFEHIQSDDINEGFINESNTYIFPVYEGIILLLPVYALFIGAGKDMRCKMDFNRERVFNYYNELKYSKRDDCVIYEDAPKWVDFRDVSSDYIHNSFTRAKQHLNSQGKYLLDIASGPIGLTEYINLSENFEIRICADISVKALMQARINYKNGKAIYICADICNIPIKDNVCDSVLCQHTLYHVPKNDQKTAVNEMYRVTKPGSNLVIVYSWFYHSWFMNISLLPVQLYRITRHFAGKIYVNVFKSKPRLYFYAHGMNWFRHNFIFGDNFEFFCWRSTNKYFLKLYIHEKFGGKKILDWLQKSENKHPGFWGKAGEYPIIKVTK